MPFQIKISFLNVMLVNFPCFNCGPVTVFKFNYFKTFLQEHYQSAKQFESRSGPIFCRYWSRSKLFAKLISRQQKGKLNTKYCTGFEPHNVPWEWLWTDIRPQGYKTWVQSQTQNKAQWLAACWHILRLKIKCNDWLLADTCPQAANHWALFWVWEWTQVL